MVITKVKAGGNTVDNLLEEVGQIVYLLFVLSKKKKLKKKYNDIIRSLQI